jgi:hypothetical protein
MHWGAAFPCPCAACFCPRRLWATKGEVGERSAALTDGPLHLYKLFLVHRLLHGLRAEQETDQMIPMIPHLAAAATCCRTFLRHGGCRNSIRMTRAGCQGGTGLPCMVGGACRAGGRISIDDGQIPFEEGVGWRLCRAMRPSWAAKFGVLAHPRVEKLDVQPFAGLRLLKIYVEGR